MRGWRSCSLRRLSFQSLFDWMSRLRVVRRQGGVRCGLRSTGTIQGRRQAPPERLDGCGTANDRAGPAQLRHADGPGGTDWFAPGQPKRRVRPAGSPQRTAFAAGPRGVDGNKRGAASSALCPHARWALCWPRWSRRPTRTTRSRSARCWAARPKTAGRKQQRFRLRSRWKAAGERRARQGGWHLHQGDELM